MADVIEFKPRTVAETTKAPEPFTKYTVQMMYDVDGLHSGYVEEGVDPDEAFDFADDMEELARMYRQSVEEQYGSSDEDVIYTVQIKRSGKASYWFHPDAANPEGVSYISEYLLGIKEDLESIDLEENKDDGS